MKLLNILAIALFFSNISLAQSLCENKIPGGDWVSSSTLAELRQSVIEAVVDFSSQSWDINSKELQVALDNGWTEEQYLGMKDQLAKVRTLVQDQFIIPDRVGILAKGHTDLMQVMVNGKVLVLARSFALTDKWEREDPDHIVALWVHEYAHTIFLTNIRAHSHFSGLYQGYDLSPEAQKSIKDDMAASATEQDPLKAKELRDSAIQRLTVNAQATKFEITALPYNELFADLVAVVFNGDEKAILKGIVDHEHIVDMYNRIDKHKDSKPELAAQLEDFIQNLKSRDFSQEMIAETWTRDEEHAFFGPVRFHLYHKYLRHAPYNQEPAKILQVVFEVIASELKEKVEYLDSINKKNVADYGVSQANIDFINAIDEAMAVAFP